MQAYRAAKDREQRINTVFVTNWSLQLPLPHQQWLPQAERHRLENQLSEMTTRINWQVVNSQEELILEKQKRILLEKDKKKLEDKLDTMVESHGKQIAELTKLANGIVEFSNNLRESTKADLEKKNTALHNAVTELAAKNQKESEEQKKEISWAKKEE